MNFILFFVLKNRTGAGTAHIADLDLMGMNKYLDWFNVMTYDFHGKFFSFLIVFVSISLIDRWLGSKNWS